MKAGTASMTAQYMALYRALESRRPLRKRLFTDPYAIRFLHRGFRIACRAAAFPPAEKLLYRIIQKRIPGSLASGIARTRYIDDLVQQAIIDGTRQVVILGAGFDTRSLRLDCLRDIPVIEIDHPDTSRMKLQLLDITPPNTRYLQADLSRKDLKEIFTRFGIDTRLPTTLIWEGVSNYLPEEAIDKTFALAGIFAEGSRIIFTYIDKIVLESPTSFFGAEKLINDLNKLEERWTFGFSPDELPSYLAQFGLKLVEDADAADYRQRYLPERKRILKGYEFYHVALAVKTGAGDPEVDLFH